MSIIYIVWKMICQDTLSYALEKSTLKKTVDRVQTTKY